MAFEPATTQDDSRPLAVVDQELVATGVWSILHGIGEDLYRPGLKDTPHRVARFWSEWIEHDAGNCDTCFEASYDEMVLVRDIAGYSMCEHHLLPFSFLASVAYMPTGNVIGLSKLVRIVQRHAHRLQLQERMTQGIAEEVIERTGSPDVAVMVKAQHLCMLMRGVQATGSSVVTSVVLGRFREQPRTKDEFLRLCSA